MTKFGVFLLSEEHGPNELVATAQAAERAGFSSVLVSDHYHPWIDRQGESPFVWSVIGAIAATTSLEVTTGVTCPIMRIHPAVVAQAAATAACMAPGRFRLGIGAGEALNEHIIGERWPPPHERLAMLDEAVSIMRELWEGGVVNHDGEHYRVVGARIYSRPSTPPPVLVSAFGDKATDLAARIGDGYVGTAPKADTVAQYREAGGKGPAIAATKVCVGADAQLARKTALELWPTSGVPGQLSQELAMPAHFEDASSLVTEEQIAKEIVCGVAVDEHVAALRRYVDAGYDEVFIAQIGDDQQAFLDLYRDEVLPRLS